MPLAKSVFVCLTGPQAVPEKQEEALEKALGGDAEEGVTPGSSRAAEPANSI